MVDYHNQTIELPSEAEAAVAAQRLFTPEAKDRCSPGASKAAAVQRGMTHQRVANF
jgi:hypothetical protein